MINIDDLSTIQKEKLFSLNRCAGFWEGTKGFYYKRTVYTVDEVGTIWKTCNGCTKTATFNDIRKLFK